MSLTINENAKQLKVTGTRHLFRRLANFPDAVNLTIGEPDFPTPEKVKQAGIQAIENNLTKYSDNSGIIETRRAVADFFEDKYKFSYDPETEIIITNGASGGLSSVFQTILNKGDEVLIPAPTYMAYDTIIKLCEADPVYFDTTDTDFLPSPERLDSLITENTKAILFNYPGNPSGATIPKEQMDELVAVLEKHPHVFILSDEIYSENVFSGEHHSFASYPEIRDRLFLLHGLSKSHSMTGWRIGFVLGPEKYIPIVVRVNASNCVCVNLPAQYAAIEALESCRDEPELMNKKYIERRDYVYEKLKSLGMDVTLPNGSIFIFPSIKKYGLSSEEFTDRLLEEAGLAVLPGSGFSKYGEGFIRISYCYSLSEIKRGMERLETFIKKLEEEK